MRRGNSFLNDLPCPTTVWRRIGQLQREMSLLRRLFRLSQAAAAELAKSQTGTNVGKRRDYKRGSND
jgi:hypothetical protein